MSLDTRLPANRDATAKDQVIEDIFISLIKNSSSDMRLQDMHEQGKHRGVTRVNVDRILDGLHRSGVIIYSQGLYDHLVVSLKEGGSNE